MTAVAAALGSVARVAGAAALQQTPSDLPASAPCTATGDVDRVPKTRKGFAALTRTATSGYRALVLPAGAWTETITATYEWAEPPALTLTRAVAAYLGDEVDVRMASFRCVQWHTGRIGFESRAGEPGTLQLCWRGQLFGTGLEETGLDLRLLDLYDLVPDLTRLVAARPGRALAGLERRQFAQRLATRTVAMTARDRICFAPRDCAGCGRRAAYRVRHRDSLCPKCRGEKPVYPPPVRTLAEARQRTGLVEFLAACWPARLRQLALADRYLQLDIFSDLDHPDLSCTADAYGESARPSHGLDRRRKQPHRPPPAQSKG